jgi:glycosyltransferase involved in cell wall biosynthesis
MKTIMYFIAAGPDGNIEQKMKNWENKRYRGDLLYGLTHFERNNLKFIFPQFKKYRTIESSSWIPNMLDILREKREYDIVYTPYYEGLQALIYLRALGLFRKRIVLWSHPPIEKRGSFLRLSLYKVFLKGIDKIIFTNKEAQKQSIESGLVAENKTAVLNWGPDLDFFNNIMNEVSGQEYEDVRFISTGVDHRDFETLVNAFKGLTLKLDLYLTEKELYEKYKDVAENIMVHFIEQKGSMESSLLSSYTVAKEQAKSSVSVICSKPVTDRKLSFGLTSLLEATGLGKPVVITRNSYMPQRFIDNNIGLLVNPDDVEDLRKNIIKIGTDSELRRRLSENSRRLALEKYNLEFFTRDLASLFENLQ